MADLLFEIGCEEIPARFLRPAIAQLAEKAAAEFMAQSIKTGKIKTSATPRRICLIAHEVATRQEDRIEVALGPLVSAAFDANGAPSKAAEGFARGQGVDVHTLEKIDTDKGVRLGVRRHIRGRLSEQVLAEILPKLVLSLSWPKSMRWGQGKIRFARPLHWLLAILDEKIIKFELAGMMSGNLTYGHRFMAPAPITVSHPSEYESLLRQAQVIVDRASRKAETVAQIETAALTAGGRLMPDPDLLEEVTDLVELPVGGYGHFDKEFLQIPKPVIISAMRSHQRYFALEDKNGSLLPCFVMINNTRARDPQLVNHGHERVLRARLADAAFFVKEDTKHPLIERLPSLNQVTYHANLGSSRDKVERFTQLALFLGQRLDLGARELQRLERACLLAKCDLVTGLVGEFPDLQGQVGEEYALRNGEDKEVAQAVREHYLPLSAGGDLPQGRLGALVGIADRLDTMSGCFALGLVPTGAADPYGLRRAAIAVIRIISEKPLLINLSQALEQAIDNLSPWNKENPEIIKNKIMEFIASRLTGILADDGVALDVSEAVIAAGMDDLSGLRAKAHALNAMKDSDEFSALAAGLKRVFNILRKNRQQPVASVVSADLLQEDAEKNLYREFLRLRDNALPKLAAGAYLEFLQELSALKDPIDNFFNQVMVMSDDERLRVNRMALLQEIADLFAKVAQFNNLQV
ncbi:MAG: glycine--tRNA ligase subunit beta [Desulfarculales bacterium]|nr:glycine--tRNA ligase subunit beta [Desulfarculales bacterium]